MRKLWTDHVVWTRDYIVAAVDDKPDAMAAANRLMRNQEDIGKAVAPRADLIKAAKAGDRTAQQQADSRWQHNAMAIATFLSAFKHDWDGDVLAFDAVYDHILMMSDALSDGIVKQFPDKFRAS
jgi:hypothetical protein